MADDDRWAFDAWRKCEHCYGTGDEPQTEPTPPNQIQDGVFSCPKCNNPPSRRPGYVLVTLSLDDLANALKPYLYP